MLWPTSLRCPSQSSRDRLVAWATADTRWSCRAASMRSYSTAGSWAYMLFYTKFTAILSAVTGVAGRLATMEVKSSMGASPRGESWCSGWESAVELVVLGRATVPWGVLTEAASYPLDPATTRACPSAICTSPSSTTLGLAPSLGLRTLPPAILQY